MGFRDRKALGHCTWKALTDGYYEELLLINVQGETARVVSATPRGHRAWWKRILGGSVDVDLAMETGERLDLDAARSTIFASLQAAPEHWTSARSLEEWTARIDAAQGFEEIIQMFY